MTTKTSSANQFRLSAIVNVYSGGDEEEVEREHARDRDADGVDAPPRDRDRDDREQVEHGQAQNRDVPLEELDRARDERERNRAGRDPGERFHPGNGTPKR